MARKRGDTSKGGKRTRVGRPSKRTPETVATIERLLMIGLPKEHAAYAAGIGPATLYRWAAEDPKFRETLETASAKGVASVMSHLWNLVNDRANAPGIRLRAIELWGRCVAPNIFGKQSQAGDSAQEHAREIRDALHSAMKSIPIEAPDDEGEPKPGT